MGPQQTVQKTGPHFNHSLEIQEQSTTQGRAFRFTVFDSLGAPALTFLVEELEPEDAAILQAIYQNLLLEPPDKNDPLPGVTALYRFSEVIDPCWGDFPDGGRELHEKLTQLVDSELARLEPEKLVNSVQLAEILPGILHATFPSPVLAPAVLLRFQDFIESNELKDKIFTRKEHADWYRRSRTHGGYSYYSDWDGFHIPSRAFIPFCAGKFDPLTSAERVIVRLIERFTGDFCLIAAASNEIGTIRHEIAHALYSLNSAYRAEVQDVLKHYDLQPVEKYLAEHVYHPSTWLDECHAYIGIDLAFLQEELADPLPQYLAAHAALLEIFCRYTPVQYHPSEGTLNDRVA